MGYSWMECYNCHNLFIDQGYPECPHCGTLNDGSEGDYEYDCPNCGEHFYEEGPPICPNCGTDYNTWWDEAPPEDNFEYIPCPQCGHANPQGISYCEECSWGIAPVEWNCPHCGCFFQAEDWGGPIICPDCGNDIFSHEEWEGPVYTCPNCSNDITQYPDDNGQVHCDCGTIFNPEDNLCQNCSSAILEEVYIDGPWGGPPTWSKKCTIVKQFNVPSVEIGVLLNSVVAEQ